MITTTIYHFDAPADPVFVTFFDTTVRPLIEAAGLPVLASFVTEESPNNFPRLPVREHEHVFVWFSRSASPTDYGRQMRQLETSVKWKAVATELREKLTAAPEVLRLQPTARSLVRD